jgi:hypothetical protein
VRWQGTLPPLREHLASEPLGREQFRRAHAMPASNETEHAAVVLVRTTVTRPPAKGLVLSSRSSVCTLFWTVLFPGPAPVSPTKQTRWGECWTGSAESRQSAAVAAADTAAVEVSMFGISISGSPRSRTVRRTIAILRLISCRSSSSSTAPSSTAQLPAFTGVPNLPGQQAWILPTAAMQRSRPADQQHQQRHPACCPGTCSMCMHADVLPLWCCFAARSKTRGMGAGRKLQIHRRNQRWAGALLRFCSGRLTERNNSAGSMKL